MQYFYIYEYSTFDIFHCFFLSSQCYGNFVMIRIENIVDIFNQSINELTNYCVRDEKNLEMNLLNEERNMIVVRC